MAKPKVSVIIPTYYRNKSLKKAIKSVLNQTYRNTELIVVDDSGEKWAEKIVKNFPKARYIPHRENQGQRSARNTGIRNSTGDYIAFLDDDDGWYPRKVEKQMKVMIRNNETGVVNCGVLNPDGPSTPRFRGEVSNEALSFKLRGLNSSLLIDSKIMENIFPLDENIPGATDAELKICLSLKTNFDFTKEVLVKRGTGGDFKRTKKKLKGRLTILRKYSDEYNRRPKRVFQSAITHHYISTANTLLTLYGWSAKAIKLYARSVITRRNSKVRSLFLTLASLLGKKGLNLADRIVRQIINN